MTNPGLKSLKPAKMAGFHFLYWEVGGRAAGDTLFSLVKLENFGMLDKASL